MKGIKKAGVLLYVFLLVLSLTGCIANPYESGVEALESKDYEKAADQFEEAVKKEKNTADAYRGLGIALWESEDYEGAKSAFENAVKEGAEKTGTLCNFLGNCELQTGDAKKAIEYYEIGLEDKDNNDELMQEMRFNVICAYEKAGDMETAKTLVLEYVADYPDDEAAKKEADFLKTR